MLDKAAVIIPAAVGLCVISGLVVLASGFLYKRKHRKQVENSRELAEENLVDCIDLRKCENFTTKSELTIVRKDNSTLVQLEKPCYLQMSLERAQKTLKELRLEKINSSEFGWHNNGVLEIQKGNSGAADGSTQICTNFNKSKDYQIFRICSSAGCLVFYLHSDSIAIQAPSPSRAAAAVKSNEFQIPKMFWRTSISTQAKWKENSGIRVKRALIFEGIMRHSLELRRVSKCDYLFELQVVGDCSPLLGLELSHNIWDVEWDMRLKYATNLVHCAKFTIEVDPVKKHTAFIYKQSKKSDNWRKKRTLRSCSTSGMALQLSERGVYCLALRNSATAPVRHALFFGVSEDKFTVNKCGKSVREMSICVRDKLTDKQPIRLEGRVCGRLRLPVEPLMNGTELHLKAAFSSAPICDYFPNKVELGGLARLLHEE